MRILHCAPGTGSFYCGSCIRDHALVQAMRRAGHDVTLVPMYLPLVTDDPSPDAPPDTPIFFGGVNVYLQQKSALFRALPRWMDRIFDARWLLQQAARRAGMTRASDLGALTLSMLRGEEGYQAKELDKMVAWLRAHLSADRIALSNVLLVGLARRLRAELGAPVICTLQGEDTFLDALPEPFKTQAWELIAERAGDVSAFIAVSGYFGERMRARLRLPAEKVHVVPNGISLVDYPTTPRTVPPPTPTIGYLARLHPGKGLQTLVDAFVRLRKSGRHPQLQLKVAGSLTAAEQPFLNGLQRQLKDAGVESAANFSPNLPRSAKITFLRSLSVFSVPATYGEAFGLYVLEALAAGVPVVQPDHAAFPELLAATGGGLLCRPDDPQDLADRLETLLTDPARAQALGAAGQAAVHARFGVDRMAADVLRIFAQEPPPAAVAPDAHT